MENTNKSYHNEALNVWLYWENKNNSPTPDFITLCSEIISAKLSSANVNFVTSETLAEFIGHDLVARLDGIELWDPQKNNIPLKADVLRVELLHKFGGLWLDIDCLPCRDFSQDIIELLQTHDFVCMKKTSKEKPYVTNNFMASRRHGAIVSAYREAIHNIIEQKNENNEKFSWTDLGSTPLTKVVNSHQSADDIYYIPEKLVHPFDYTESSTLEEVNPLDRSLELLSQDTYCVMLYNSSFSDEIKLSSRDFILKSPTLLGELFRHLLDKDVFQFTGTNLSGRSLSSSDIRLIFSTMSRPNSCEEFLKSIRTQLGTTLKISFAVQGNANQELYERLASNYGADVHFLPADCGLSAARNYLVKNTSEKLIFLCDDDFKFTENLNLNIALDILNRDESIFILGGMFDNFYYNTDDTLKSRSFSNFDHLILDIPLASNSKIFLPTEYATTDRFFVNEKYFYQFTDTINNCALIDRRLFDEFNIYWDENFKIMGEHEDFYLSIKYSDYSDRIRVAYTNALLVEHHRKSNPDYQHYRDRNEGLKECIQKWDVSNFVFLGKRIDSLNSLGEYARVQFRNWKNQQKDSDRG